MLIMGVGGGAVFPPIQGAIADASNTAVSQCVPMVGYVFVLIYALFLAEPFGKKTLHHDVESLDKKVGEVAVVELSSKA